MGNIGLIPRIDLTPSETSSPFRMKRRQFPIRLCFAMTINKAQGQSILRPVSSHGQLYVALSRAGLPHRTKVILIDVKDTHGPIQDYNGKYKQMSSTTKYYISYLQIYKIIH